MDIALAVVCGLYGLVIGSFLNVVIDRVPKKESIVKPRSRCPRCGASIAARDNVPVLSWLVLGGKCRNCGEPISVHYPLVEAGTGVLFATLGVRFGFDLALLGYLFSGAGLVALLVVDLKTYLLPNRILYPTIYVTAPWFVLAAAVDGKWHHLEMAVLSALSAFMFFYVIHIIQPKGMGFGDVRLSFLLGLITGWLSPGHTVLALFLGFLLGSVVGIAMMLGRRRGMRDHIPFGPWLIAGAWISIYVGDAMLKSYRGGM